MCQQWFSVLGLVLDVIGFLMIAFEWHLMFKREMHERLQRIVEDYAKEKALREGEDYEDLSASDHTMWREFSKLWGKDKRFRQRLFYPGVALVLMGFLGQLIGSLPYANSFFGFASCS
jgi:hypothetical protein